MEIGKLELSIRQPTPQKRAAHSTQCSETRNLIGNTDFTALVNSLFMDLAWTGLFSAWLHQGNEKEAEERGCTSEKMKKKIRKSTLK